MKKILYILSTLTLSMGLMTSCEADPISEEDALNINKTDADIQPTLSIQEFKTQYMTAYGIYQPVRSRDNGKGLFSIDTIAPSQTKPIYIVGRVISDDYCGNMYKTMVIQDCKHPGQGIKLSVDASNLSGLFPVGQKIAIRVNDLYIGRYAGEAQLCIPSYNDNIYAKYAGEKVGWAPGRIPLNVFLKHVIVIGAPEPNKVVVDTMTIDQIRKFGTQPSLDSINTMCGKLVYIKGVHFDGTTRSTGYNNSLNLTNPNLGDGDNDKSAVFASTTLAVGYTQNRCVQDASGNYIGVATSEYAKYARYILPGYEEAFRTNSLSNVVQYTGDLIGILAYYQDNGTKTCDGSEYSIYPRFFPGISSNDADGKQQSDFINFKNAAGDDWSPVEWSKSMSSAQ